MSTNSVEASPFALSVRSRLVLPTPLGPTIRIFAPDFSRRRSSALMIFMFLALWFKVPACASDGGDHRSMNAGELEIALAAVGAFVLD
jgi:hypothetical protein